MDLQDQRVWSSLEVQCDQRVSFLQHKLNELYLWDQSVQVVHEETQGAAGWDYETWGKEELVAGTAVFQDSGEFAARSGARDH